jgi:uncharacterized protein (UPF0548 family)
MFLATRPAPAVIARFLRESQDLPLSYAPAGIVRERPSHRRCDEQVVPIGHGPEDFQRARAALLAWAQFDVGWVELFPRGAGVEIGTNVAVVIRHLGFWSVNGARVLYHVGGADADARAGFAYGTLTNHAESGEELFEVCLDGATGDVMFRIRAVSWPQSVLAGIGQPIVRLLQARFRRDSARAMTRATRARDR